MENEVINFSQFLNLLRIHGFDKSYDEDGKQKLFEFFVSKRFSDRDVKAIINGAKKKAILSQAKFVRFQDVKNIIMEMENEYDFKIFKLINAFDQKFKQYYLDSKLDYTHIDDVIRDSWKTAVAVSEDVNKSLDNFSAEAIDTMWALACVYNSLSEYLENVPILMSSQRSFLRVADAIMMTKINKLNASTLKRLNNYYPNLNKFQYELFDDFLDALMTKTDDISIDEVFSQGDVQDLLLHTSSLVAYASKQKLIGARRALNMYIDNVLDMTKEKPTLHNFSTKNIFLRAGSVLTASPEKINNTVNLLLGKSMQDISSRITSKVDLDTSKMNTADVKIYLLKQIFPNMKIHGMSLDKHMYILKNRSTMFINLSTGNLYNATMTIINCLYRAYETGESNDENWYSRKQKLEGLGFNLDKLFHGDNIFDIFPSKFSNSKDVDSEKEENFIENVRLMSKIISAKDMQKIINHNFNFLTQDVQTLKSEITTIFSAAEDHEDLVSSINKFVNQVLKGKGKDTSSSTSKGNKGPRLKLNKEKIKIEDLDLDVEALEEMGITIDSKVVGKTDKQGKKTTVTKKGKKSTTAPDIDDKEIDKLIKFVEENPEVDDDLSVEGETDDEVSTNDQRGAYYLVGEVSSEINAIINSVGDFNNADWFDANAEIKDTILYAIYISANRDMSTRLYSRLSHFNRQIDDLINEAKSNDDIKLILDNMQDNMDIAISRLDAIIATAEKYMSEAKELVAELQARKIKGEIVKIPTEYDEFVEANESMVEKLIQEKAHASDSEKKIIEKLIEKYGALNEDIKPLKVKSYKEAGKKKKEDRQMLHEILEDYQKYVEINEHISKLKEILQSAKVKLNKKNFKKVEKEKSKEQLDKEAEILDLQRQLEHAIQVLDIKKAEFNSTYKSKESSKDGHGKRLKGVIAKLEKQVEDLKNRLENLSNDEHLQ